MKNINKKIISFCFILSSCDEINWNLFQNIVQHIFSDVNCKIHFSNNLVQKVSSKNEIEQILKLYHDSPLGGHEGVERTFKRISEKYKWPKMRQDIKKYIEKCDLCQRNKILKVNKIPLKITTTAEKPFEQIFLDIVGPLPKTKNGNNYILTIQDDLTKTFIAKAIPEASAETTCKAFMEIGICVYGVPKKLVTDRGTNFTSKLFEHLCKLLRVEQVQTSAYHPQSNGALERCHRTLKEYLRSYVCENLNDWDDYLSQFCFTYNTSAHSSTGYSPYELMFGHKAELPVAIRTAQKENTNYFCYLKDLRFKLESIHKLAKDSLIKTKESRKETYDTKSNEWVPMWGDKVLLMNFTIGSGQKLQGIWNGPHEVVAIKSPETTQIRLKPSNKITTVHNNRLKLYKE